MNIAILKIPPLKIPEGIKAVGDLAHEIGTAINGMCFVIPMDYEFTAGKQAEAQLKALHDEIHKALGIKDG